MSILALIEGKKPQELGAIDFKRSYLKLFSA